MSSPQHSRTLQPPESRWLKFCLPLLFVLLGLVFATWASRIPAVRDALHLNAGELGVALLCAGVGGLASFPLAAWMVARHGQARAAFCGGLALLASLPCIAFSSHLGLLMAALALLGGAASCFDVAINAIGAIAEKKAGRSIMSMLHAWFCVGTLSGALTGSAAASLGVSVALHFSLIAALMALPLWQACRVLAPTLDAPTGKPQAPSDASSPELVRGAASRFRLPPRPLLVLGLLGFCGAITEGGIADWSGVFMRDQAGASAGMAPLGYAGFTGAMLMARLFADRAKDRFGAQRVIGVGSTLATLGIGIAVVSALFGAASSGAAGISIVVTIAGFALAGAGLAGVFPFVFSAAGSTGPSALAGVATISYCGSLVGPPLIGFIGQFAGLPSALASLGVLCAAMAWVGARARSLG